MNKPVGLTKDAGWQMGYRKTLPVPQAKAWDFFFSREGVKLWFGELEGSLQAGVDLKSKEGTEGKITTFVEGSHLRMKWKKPDWEHFSMLQIRLMPAGNPDEGSSTTFAFHQDQLLNEKEREEMKQRWEGVMEKMAKQLNT